MSLRSRFAFLLLTVALLATFALPAHAQFTTITMTNVQNGDGLPLALGTTCWLGANNSGQPIGYRAGGTGQVTTNPVCRDVINGAVQTTYKGATIGTLKVADTTLTTPANVCYKVTVTDTSNGKVVVGSYAGAKSGYDCVQPSGTTWSFDTYTPAGTPGVTQVAGPTGPQGPAGLTFNAGDNITFTGNNTHSGTEDFARIGGLLYTSPDLEGPGTALNLNECQALARQQQIARSLSWNALHLISDWHGHQACGTSDPNANYPSAIGANPPTFAELLDMQPDNLLIGDQSFVLRANQHWDFHNSNASLASASTGVQAGFAASSAFTGTGAVVEFGAPDGTSLATGGQPQGVQLVNAGVYGYLPGSGTWRAGSICIRNQYAQEFSYAQNVEIDGCQYGLDKEDSGTGFGSINDGPYHLLKINMTGCNTTACRAIRIGKGNVANTDVSNARGFTDISANTSGALVQPDIAIEVNGAGITFERIHLEQWKEGMAFGDLGFAKNNTVVGLECDGTVASPFTTCAHIYNTNEFGNTYGNTIMGVNSTGNITNLLVDDRSGGGTATWASTGTLGFYFHGLGGTVISTSPEIKSNMSFATGTALSAITSPTATVAFAMGGFGVTFNASSTNQAASILNIQGSSGNTSTVPLVNVTTSAATEVGYTFSQAGKTQLAPDSNQNVFLKNLQTATSGANINSTSFVIQGRFWNGTASAGETVTPQFTYGTGANPTTTFKFAMVGAGSGLHNMDLSNWHVLHQLSTPATSTATCTAGELWADSGFVYVCTAANIIKRAALSTF